MSDETKNELPVESEDLADTAIDAAADLVLGQTVPAPIRKGFVAACKRLGVAIADMPAGWFERRSTENWADTKSRVRIKEALTDEIIKKLEVDPTFPQRAVELFGNRILREQFSLEKVLDFTKDILKSKEYDNSENQQSDSQAEETITPDWFNIFEKEASQKSSEDMQRRFAKVLAGEIEKPGSHSIKVVKSLGNMDQPIAELFQRVCSMSVVLEDIYDKNVYDVRVPSIGRDPGQSELKKYGLSFRQISMLIEYDLIVPNFSTWHDYQKCILNKERNVVDPIRHQGRYWILKPSPERLDSNEFKLDGVQLSYVGFQLSHIIEQIPTRQYTEDLKEFFAKNQLEMTEVSIERREQNIGWRIIQR